MPNKHIITQLIAKLDEYLERIKFLQTFLFLHQKNVIGLDVMKAMQELCEFRNELVHDYLYLDPERVYDEFVKAHDKISLYVKDVKQFLRSFSARVEVKMSHKEKG